MLLDKIDVSTSSGPDILPRLLRQCLVTEIIFVINYIFSQSFYIGKLSTEWTETNDASSNKKNYSPVYWTNYPRL